MIKQFKYILAITATIGSYLGAATTYIPGAELANGTRSDIIRVGSAGGFSDFVNPSSAIKTLYITLMESGTGVEPNTTPTFSSYLGTGVIPHLPATLKDLYVMGNASDFMTLVLGDSLHDAYSSAYPPAAYALPTPAANTTIHFLLSDAPVTAPEKWFQGPLLSGSRLVVEPNSQDPFVNTVLPMSGGKIIIGSPVAPEAGFSALLDSITGSCAIQRHPRVLATEAYAAALITLEEATTFPFPVYGISLAGAFAVQFDATSNLIDPAPESTDAGYTVSANTILTLTHSQRDLPEVNNTLAAGGTSKVVISTSAVKLPTLVPTLI